MTDDTNRGDRPDRTERAQTALDRAIETARPNVREQLLAIEDGLTEVVGGESTRESRPHGDRLDRLAAKLDLLRREADGETPAHIETAQTLIEDYERDRTTE